MKCQQSKRDAICDHAKEDELTLVSNMLADAEVTKERIVAPSASSARVHEAVEIIWSIIQFCK